MREFRWSVQGGLGPSRFGIMRSLNSVLTVQESKTFQFIPIVDFSEFDLPYYLGYDPLDSRYGQTVSPVYLVKCFQVIDNTYGTPYSTTQTCAVAPDLSVVVNPPLVTLKKRCVKLIVGLSETADPEDAYLNLEVARLFAESGIYDEELATYAFQHRPEVPRKPSTALIYTTPFGIYLGSGEGSTAQETPDTNVIQSMFGEAYDIGRSLDIIKDINEATGRPRSTFGDVVFGGEGVTGQGIISWTSSLGRPHLYINGFNGIEDTLYAYNTYVNTSHVGASRVILPIMDTFSTICDIGRELCPYNKRPRVYETAYENERYRISVGSIIDTDPIEDAQDASTWFKDSGSLSPSMIRFYDITSMTDIRIGRCVNWWVIS